MNNASDIREWPEKIRQRYQAYLKTMFFFKDKSLRESFQSALQGDTLLKGPISEQARNFKLGAHTGTLASECFPDQVNDLLPALIDGELYAHQEQAVRTAYMNKQNVVVATGTASGKTESFLYPILFELYRQHLTGHLQRPGVRAMILYPMNALANDQRERLGKICQDLRQAGSDFAPSFGQYIGQTPKNINDRFRNASDWEDQRHANELIFREEMRETPPHILLTNYSMLEYLLIRPSDSPLFDDGRGINWQFLVLDEAHQYHGTKGMEIGMLIRRLKQRLRSGGRQEPFRCIATSATLSSSQQKEDRQVVKEFAQELFGEPFLPTGLIFGEQLPPDNNQPPRRYHAFLRALEGAFLVHKNGTDTIALNRRGSTEDSTAAQPLEIALCRECGQHYYVGKKDKNGILQEAIRDPSHHEFGVEYYMPLDSKNNRTHILCRKCGSISTSEPVCKCNAGISVQLCASHQDHPDQLRKCEACDYQRGSIGDPVQEIVHGSDGPNAVIATAMHQLLPENQSRILAFADSRQEAAFFAWYVEDSYEKLRDRNLMLRALSDGEVSPQGLSIEDFKHRLFRQWERAELLQESDTDEHKNRKVLTTILREALTDERRLSLAGVGLTRWFVQIPNKMRVPQSLQQPPWNLSPDEIKQLLGYLLDELRSRGAMALPAVVGAPRWADVSPERLQQAYGQGRPGGRANVKQWGHPQSAIMKHFLARLLANSPLDDSEKRSEAKNLMATVWDALQDYDGDPVLIAGNENGTFRLNPSWLRIKHAEPEEIWLCNTCANLSPHNIRGICIRNGCPGKLLPLSPDDQKHLKQNHYRVLYESKTLPRTLRSKEHTAQIESNEARERQRLFKNGAIHLLSSSTTFEVGVDLGDLEIVFLRNVPPEPFNYAQRAGRAGRRDTPGLALTYCRRNPHDLYHYEEPEKRVVNGRIRPPRLQITNEKIILRHMVATALSALFKEQGIRFKNVQAFVGDWNSPSAASALNKFCKKNQYLKEALLQIVPKDMHEKTGISSNKWAEHIAGEQSRLAKMETEVCNDYTNMEMLENEYSQQKKYRPADRVTKRLNTIAKERTLDFLSRRAIIPKYGFPVDVVELDTHPRSNDRSLVSLQRDLSQAIAEYAPGGKVVANKKEWESCGIKVLPGKTPLIRHYKYDEARNFRHWGIEESGIPADTPQYLSPEFGFVTTWDKAPKEPRRKAQRLYTTRPFFGGFTDAEKKPKNLCGVQITEAQTGTLVILCEGKKKSGFYICLSCGTHTTERQKSHNSPTGRSCLGSMKRYSLGHELVTDIVRMQFPRAATEWDTYSLAYAILLGTADALNVPDTDLNVTVAGVGPESLPAIVLYDNVPGGAGLVAQLGKESIFRQSLDLARDRVNGNCGCDTSCYGCLRSYRNQFAHPHLKRVHALELLNTCDLP